MKFIDLGSLKTHKVYEYICYSEELGDINNLLDLSITEFNKRIKYLFDPLDWGEENAALFEVSVENAEEDDFEYLVDILVDTIISINTTNESREREQRLGTPKNLREVNCNTVPLQKAVNNKCHYDVFAIHIYDKTKGWEYNIVSE